MKPLPTGRWARRMCDSNSTRANIADRDRAKRRVAWRRWASACDTRDRAEFVCRHPGRGRAPGSRRGGTGWPRRGGGLSVGLALTLTAVFIPDENGWTMAQLADWPAVGKPLAARDLPPTRRTTPDG